MDGRPELQLRRNCEKGLIFFEPLYSSPHSLFSSYILSLGLCLILFLLFPAKTFGKTLVHAFHISYSHIEWSFLFPRGEMVLVVAEASHIKIKL